MNRKNIENIDFLTITSEEAAELGLNVIFKEKDGTYDWIYCMDFLKNRSMFYLFIKLFTIVFGFFALIAILTSGKSNILWALRILAIVYGVVMLIVIFSFWLTNMLYKSKYMLVYQMNNDGIMFSQTSDQAQITKTLAATSTAVSAAADSPGGVIAGIGMTIKPNGAYSKFSKVKSVKGRRKDNLIWVNTFMQYQMVYIPPDSYDFVWNYITKRCKNARISEK